MALFRKKITADENGIMNKNTVNIPLLDLRRYSPQALANIKTLNAAVVIFPKEPDDALIEAYGNIARKNVASEIYIENDKEIKTYNGIGEINCGECSNAVYFLNGLYVVKNTGGQPADIILNGKIIYGKGAAVNLILCNGSSENIDFEIKNTKIFKDDASIGRDFIENTQNETVVICQGFLTLELDITPELLKSKKLYFCADTIKCSKRSLGTVQAMSCADKYKAFH